MSNTNNDNDIEALLKNLFYMQQDVDWRVSKDAIRYHAALTALVAERDELLKENVALRDRLKAKQDEVLDREFEMDAMRKRIAEREAASKPADRDLRERLLESVLRERLVESALRVARDTMMTEAESSKLGRQTVWIVNGALAAMRKEATDDR